MGNRGKNGMLKIFAKNLLFAVFNAKNTTNGGTGSIGFMI
jgi:hypothetical protein